MYRALNFHYYVYRGVEGVPLVQLGVWSFVVCMFASGLAIGVVVAVGLLFVMEMKAVFRNRTGIEDWIVEKADDRLENLFLMDRQQQQHRREETRAKNVADVVVDDGVKTLDNDVSSTKNPTTGFTLIGPGGLRAPCVLACAMRSLAIVITIIRSSFCLLFSKLRSNWLA